MLTKGINFRIYSSVITNFDNESRPCCVDDTARIIRSISSRFESSGFGSIRGLAKLSMASSDRASSTGQRRPNQHAVDTVVGKQMITTYQDPLASVGAVVLGLRNPCTIASQRGI